MQNIWKNLLHYELDFSVQIISALNKLIFLKNCDELNKTIFIIGESMYKTKMNVVDNYLCEYRVNRNIHNFVIDIIFGNFRQ